ncbi:MAG: CDP-diacylglycerol--glycerol-3-phosphate 3-phosphatidyltransferase [Acidimicrobiaceae bacterium]|nr:CDP-diacylglycerol--glycerol-3-phosphate 3-phosphatidyltransferase [Acidimicrobiaceae bacterium]
MRVLRLFRGGGNVLVHPGRQGGRGSALREAGRTGRAAGRHHRPSPRHAGRPPGRGSGGRAGRGSDPSRSPRDRRGRARARRPGRGYLRARDRHRRSWLRLGGGVSAPGDAQAPAQASLLHPANLLTLARLLLSPLLFLLILQAEESRGASWAAFGLGVAMAGTDFFDGRVARRANVTSRSGAFLDPLADKVVVLGAAYCLVAVERYWWVPVTILAFRELGITAWRARWAGEGVSIPARRSAKYKTFVQGVALAMAIMPTLENSDAVLTVALWVAVVFTVATGLQYMLDGRSVRAQSRSPS